MANTNNTTSDIVVNARFVDTDEDTILLKFFTDKEQRLMRGAHDVHVVPSSELEALHNGAYSKFTNGNYTVDVNLLKNDHRAVQVMLFAKEDNVILNDVVFEIKVWNSKKLADASVPHHGLAISEEYVVAERLGAESGDAPTSPKKQKLDEHAQD
ncbi:hypothetical protein [Epiphyas postvittana nucleopolyhedrovirus]|uniref:TLP-20 n=1 Tax=Epiphyas postvittana nucleopolyhedrovirus TaxID=70600 RepID=Q91GH9_NPVEP|nr:hypothetical protein [Epiphyas postvittana nucleopolyhedrovirus]AAK85638.1 unknown [Epiphyas postvittana nucleopolyhedrovirus]